MRLTDALRLRPGMSVAFTGAGGKSSSLATLAQETRGRFPIVLTTTTRLAIAQRSIADEHVVVTTTEDARRLSLRADRTMLVTGPEEEEKGKLLGLADDLLAEVTRRAWGEGALVAIEADGARGRWLKAPAAREPVVPSWIDIVVPVAGLQAIGSPLSAQIAHRPELVGRLLALAQGEMLTAEHLAALISSRDGGLKGIPAQAEVRVLLNGIDRVPPAAAHEVGGRLLVDPRVRAVLTGESDAADPVRGVAGRVAAVVLAAGAGKRFGGPKQTVAWKGRPLVAHAIQAAKDGGLSPIVVVLGAHAAAVREAAAGEGVVFVDNPAWEDGQSTSVQAGLLAVERQVEAAVFLLADMPRVNGATIRRLVEGHRTSLPAMVAPIGGGRRGNPILFDRRVFPGLYALTGDQGGRSLLERWPWQAIEADPQEFVEVDLPDDLETLERAQ